MTSLRKRAFASRTTCSSMPTAHGATPRGAHRPAVSLTATTPDSLPASPLSMVSSSSA